MYVYIEQKPYQKSSRLFSSVHCRIVSHNRNISLIVSARIISTEGHPAHIKKDMIVRIVKVLDTVPFYDLMMDGKYHRWIADFEAAPLYAVRR